jgi:LysM repeat protein
LLIAIVFIAAVPAMAAENGGIGGKPANPRADNPRTESIFVYELAPGSSVQDTVEVYNNTEEQKTIAVYPTDSVISSGGAFACAQAADPIKDVGGWIKLDKSQVTLSPSTSEKIDFTVTVPDFAEPGEHNGCIAIQEANAESANVGNGIALSFRSAIRVAITVPGEITKELTIRDVTLTDKSDKLAGSVLLRNNGNVSLDTKVQADVRGLFGATVQSISGTYPALPQTVTELNFEYNKPFWGGFYRLNTIATYNPNTSESLGEGNPTQEVKKSSSYVYVTPAPVALFVQIAFVGVLIAAVWYAWQRFVAQPKALRKYVDYTVAKGDDIQSIATNSQANWKHLAKVNNIKAPYLIKEGDVIKVPQPAIDTSKEVQSPKKSAKKTRKTTKKED